MNVDAILSYKSDPAEDYYGLLGCDSSASTEQIVAEFKARAKDCHPDKNKPDSSSREKFQQLLRAKEALVDPKERSLYDAWRSAGIAMSYSQWRSLKDAVKSSMHWATPKTAGRMLEDNTEEPLLSLTPSPLKEDDLLLLSPSTDEVGTFYDPTPYDELGFRIKTPPLSIWSEDAASSQLVQKPIHSQPSLSADNLDPATALRRAKFARRQSTIGAMVMAEKWEDSEIRRRFRNYEI